jgi:hypothetical protein
MKTFLKFACIPLALFVVFFALPKLFAVLFNAHSDVGVLAIIVIVCGLFGVVATKFYNKENTNEVK